ncbi:pyrrolidone-carboxylate peptidase [Staphylococcus microti]|uniref:Pyrrolidone-carboxylate peptidase n=1 Tax=Staphylococcus microti TaxID=569857 RepID=A0A0D6XRE5_9STAP|nr:pyroglutamyl-peptidase I [Staphylococcus microti]KIX90388.1 pyrrolidone-carboxylate peptidase [Staphylococcus microti]PNZ77549.1 pyroglutamyl-peptidase I [Staphylococcus microti]SUM56420.1 putative pyrrolidone-carboxylate peptidase [Staphylococcus microti]
MNILVTAFDPFGEEQTNPALEAVKLLPEKIGEHTITKLEIPTVFNESVDVIKQQLKIETYDAVLAIGQAGGRFTLTPERVGINIDDARIADNKGNQPIDKVIQQNGAPAYFSNMPVKRLTQAIKDAGVPASLSNSAGTFVCNHVLYQLGYLHATTFPHIQFGFIHVPFIPEQVTNKPNTPSMALDTIVKGLEAAITALSEDNRDDTIALGETH